MLSWKTIDRQDFEQLVESLVVRVVDRVDPQLVARAIDGRGGDGGIDIDIRERATDRIVRIFQLKHFPEGFSGGYRKVRRRQIRESFERAMEHAPDEWILVVPCNLTPDEWGFVRALARDGSHAVGVTAWGQAELDVMLAEHPDLADYAERTPLRTALDRVGRSSATLATTDDLVAETRRLHQGAEAWSNYWRSEVSYDNGRPMVRFEALRDDSAQREPLQYTFTFDWEKNERLRDKFSDALDYGITEKLVLPPDVVTEMRRVGPEWFAGVSGAGTLVLGPGKRDGTPGRVTCVSADGRNLASRRATIDRAGVGGLGGRVDISIADGLHVTVQMEKDTGAGTLNFSAELTGLSGAAARDQLRFRQALGESTQLRLQFGDMSSDLGIGGDPLESDAGLMMLADDAAAIEELVGTVFSWPAQYQPSAVERAWIRVTRLILEGKTTLVPDFREFDIEVTGMDDTIEAVMRDGAPVKFTPGEWSTTMFGEELAVGPISLAHPMMRATSEANAPNALCADETRSIHFAPVDGGPLQIWMPERSGSDNPGPVEPWGIPRIAELTVAVTPS